MFDAKRTVRAFALVLLSASLLATVATAAGEIHGVVNVNTATLEELQLLPGIGASRAAAMIELRKQRGGFKSVDELKDVKGIGDAGLERLRPHVRLDGKTTVSAR